MCVEKHAGERITERQHRRCTDLNRMSARMGVGQSRAMRFEHHPPIPDSQGTGLCAEVEGQEPGG